MKKIVMNAKIKVFEPLDVDQIKVGGFEFLINGDDILLNFKDTLLQVEKRDKCSVISCSFNNGLLFYKYDINDESGNEEYQELYRELGFNRTTIMTKFLSQVSKIKQFRLYPFDDKEGLVYFIESIEFTDENNNTYQVNKKAIRDFNIKNLIINFLLFSESFRLKNKNFIDLYTSIKEKSDLCCIYRSSFTPDAVNIMIVTTNDSLLVYKTGFFDIHDNFNLKNVKFYNHVAKDDFEMIDRLKNFNINEVIPSFDIESSVKYMIENPGVNEVVFFVN